MKINRQQLLQKLLLRHESSATVWEFLKHGNKSTFLLFGFILTLFIGLTVWSFVISYDQCAFVGLFMVGFSFGAIARELAWTRSTVSSWPFVDSLIDWKIVEAELGRNQEGADILAKK